MSVNSKTLFLASYRVPNSHFCSGCPDGAKKLRIGLPLCNQCYSVAYCSRGCQKADWSKHKTLCQIISTKAHFCDIYNEPTAAALAPLGEDSCSHFPAMMSARGIPRDANVVYIISSANTVYGDAMMAVCGLLSESKTTAAGVIPGFAPRYVRRLPNKGFGYLHTAEEIQSLIFLHQDVRRIIAKIFDLGVPNTRVLVQCHRSGDKTSVYAGTKELEWPDDSGHTESLESPTTSLISFLKTKGYNTVPVTEVSAKCHMCQAAQNPHGMVVLSTNPSAGSALDQISAIIDSVCEMHKPSR